MTALVERPDLTKPRGLSKSELGVFDTCQTKAWFAIHDPRPFITSEQVEFGSTLDAGVEVVVKYLSSGQPIDMARAFTAMMEVADRHLLIDFQEAKKALVSFVDEVVPRYDWTRAVTQASITTDIEGLGTCNGHPDIILGDGSVFDLKATSKSRDVYSVELGFYALLVEATGRTVPRVGYLNYVRLKKPVWYLPEMPVTDELRRWAYENAAAYVRAKKADSILNAKAAKPGNYSMTGGPKYGANPTGYPCGSCPANPANGGPCQLVRREEAA